MVGAVLMYQVAQVGYLSQACVHLMQVSPSWSITAKETPMSPWDEPCDLADVLEEMKAVGERMLSSESVEGLPFSLQGCKERSIRSVE